MNRVAMFLALALATLAVTTPVRAGGCCAHRCDFCGCQCECESVCRLIVGTKTVPKITYCVECNEICLPGPSKCCGHHVECDVNACTGCPEKHLKHDWIPNPCGKIRTKKSLVKIETPQEVKTYKWVVQHVCPHCAQSGCLSQDAPAAAGAEQIAAETKLAAQPAPAVQQTGVVQASAMEPIGAPAEMTPAAEVETAKPISPTLFVKSKLMALLGK